MIVTPLDLYLQKQDPWYYIKNFGRTFDERSTKEIVDDLEFPDDECLAYLCKAVWEEFNAPGNNVILVPKSRQLMISWTLCAGFSVWMCQNRPMTAIGIQSKDIDDGNYQIMRAKYLWSHQPKLFQSYFPLKKPLERQNQTSIEWLNGSKLEAVPQGGDQVRSRVLSILICDEAQKQEYFEDSMRAAKRSVKLIIPVGTARPGYFQKLVEDTEDGTYDTGTYEISQSDRNFGTIRESGGDSDGAEASVGG